ncbi:MAG TPA: hypothetical protein VGC67_12645 [Cellulomonas sp.]
MSALRTDDRLVYAPLPGRPVVRWPEGKTVAVWHAPNVEHYDFVPPGGASPQGRVAAPDVQHYMHRDFGNRVGFWRLARLAEQYRIPSTVSLSLMILEEMPQVRDEIRRLDWEVMSHGLSNLRPLYGYDEAEERAFLEQSLALAHRYLGRGIAGMLGPKISGTDLTCDLMAEHGMTYHADWIHDEQPRPLRTRTGARLVSMPYSYLLNDVPTLHARSNPGSYLVTLVKNQVGRLLRDAEQDGQGRVTCVATHPYLMGQPHLVGDLEEIFAYLRSDERIWLATAEEIAEHYLTHSYDEQLAHATALAGGRR